MYIMNIAFVGGVKFSYELLECLLNNGIKPSVVFSYDESKRKFYSDFCSFDKLVKSFDLKHIKVNNINDQQNIEIFKKIKPDLILVLGWSQLLNNEIIQIPKFGVIGSHPTELPKYRGRSPIPWTILKGLKKSALTFFYITEGIDNGDILDQKTFTISLDDDATSLYKKITDLGKKMLIENIKKFQNGKLIRIKQNPKDFLEYWSKRKPEDGKINWNKTNEEINKLIRATTHPYPGAYTTFKNSKLIIWKAICSNEQSSGIGKILQVDKTTIKIGTGDGIIILKLVSFNNNKEEDPIRIFSANDVGLILGE